jgi:hypothetical protein
MKCETTTRSSEPMIETIAKRESVTRNENRTRQAASQQIITSSSHTQFNTTRIVTLRKLQTFLPLKILKNSHYNITRSC